MTASKTHFPRPRSEQAFAEALRFIPGGVNSPVRAFRGVGGEPFFVDRAQGACIYDIDGNEYIDFVGTWGPAILGHAPAVVIEAVREAAGRGLSFGIPNPYEVEMARLNCSWVPSIEKVRLVNRGTEATMSATGSSSSPAATTATSIRCWSRRAAGHSRTASRTAPGCRARWRK